MKNRGWTTISAIVCVGLLGCTVQTGEAPGETGETGETAVASKGQALIGGWAVGTFHWDQGQPPMVLESATTHVCVLTGLGGHFAGTGEWVKVDVPAGSSTWMLRGSSAQSGVFGEAHCFKLSDFNSSAPSYKTIYSVEETAQAWSRGNNADSAHGGGCQQSQVNLGLGRAFAFIEGMQGEMAGGGEFSLAVQSPSVNTPNFLRSQICTQGSHYSYGVNLLVNFNRTTLAKFMNASGSVRDDLNVVSEFSTQAFNKRNFATVMAPLSQAMCALTRIQGKFYGEQETVRIRPSGNNWLLEATAGFGAGSGGVSVSARCFAKDQR